MALFSRLPNLLRTCRPQLSSLHSFVQHAAQPSQRLARVPFRPGLPTANAARLAAARITVRNLFTVPLPVRDLAAIYKKAEERFTRTHIKVLPNRPTHEYQPRDEYVKLLDKHTKSLRSNENVVVAAYVKGDPASGKTQIAREFGEKYYEEKTKLKRNKMTVSTLYARSESAFLRSYFRLVLDLGCPLQRLNSAHTKEEKLTLYQTEIQEKLRGNVHRDWLLVIDGMTTDSMLMIIRDN